MKAFKDAVPIRAGFVALVARDDWQSAITSRRHAYADFPVSAFRSVSVVFPDGVSGDSELVLDLFSGLKESHPSQSSDGGSVWVCGVRHRREFVRLEAWKHVGNSDAAARLLAVLKGVVP